MTWPRLLQILFIALLCSSLPAPEAHCRPGPKDGLRFLSIDIQPKIVAPNKTVKVAVVYELKGVDEEGLKVTERKSLKFDGNEIALLENKQVRRTEGKWIIDTTFLIPASATFGEYEILQVVFSNYFSRSIKGVFRVQEQQQMVTKRLERASEYAQQLKNEADADLQQDKKAGQQKKVVTAPAAPEKETKTEVAVEDKPVAPEPAQSVIKEPEKTTPGTTGGQLAKSDEVEQPKILLPKKEQKVKKEVVESTEPVQKVEPAAPEQVSQDSQEKLEPSLSDEPQTSGSQTVETVEQKVDQPSSVQPEEIADSVAQGLKDKEPAETIPPPPSEPTPAVPETASDQPAQQTPQEQPKTKPVTDLNIGSTVTIDDRESSRDNQPEQTKEDNMRLLKDAHEEIRLTGPDDTPAAEKPIEPPSQAVDRTDEEVVDPDEVFGDSAQPERRQVKNVDEILMSPAPPKPEIAQVTQPEEDQTLLQPKEAGSIQPLAADERKQPISPEPVVEQTEQVQANQLVQKNLTEQSEQQDETTQQQDLLWLHNRDRVDPRVPEQAKRERLEGGGYGPWMLSFPLGSFFMGGERYNEKPIHNVNIEQEFSIMIHEVTIGMFQEYQKSLYGDKIQPHELWAEELPVTNISWRDAASFAIWLSQKSGTTYRLPTEAEWEYVAKRCNKAEQTASPLYETDIDEDQEEPERVETVYNAESDLCKIYGLKGNVWEWTQDCWSERYTDDHSSQKAYSYPKCGNRVVRGGSYMEDKEKRTPTVRMGIDQKTKVPYIGFRLVRVGPL